MYMDIILIEDMNILMLTILAFGLSVLSNIMFSIWYNVALLKQTFSVKKIFKSIFKTVFLIIGIICLICTLNIIPIILQESGLDINNSPFKDYNIVTIIACFLPTIFAYTKEAILTFKDIITYKPINNKEEISDGKNN